MKCSIKTIIMRLIRGYSEYLSAKEFKFTEQERNIAYIKIQTKQIEANTEIMKAFFLNNQQERERLYFSAQQVLDKALEKGDERYAELACQVIKLIRQKNPFTF
jgi:hypothetical protein